MINQNYLYIFPHKLRSQKTGTRENANTKWLAEAKSNQKNTCRPKIRHRWKAHQTREANDVFWFSPGRGFACFFFVNVKFLYFFALLQTIECGEPFFGMPKKIGPKKTSMCIRQIRQKSILQKKNKTQPLNTKKAFKKQKKKAGLPDLHQLTNLLTGLQFFQECLLSVEITSTWDHVSPSLTKSKFFISFFLVEIHGEFLPFRSQIIRPCHSGGHGVLPVSGSIKSHHKRRNATTCLRKGQTFETS